MAGRLPAPPPLQHRPPHTGLPLSGPAPRRPGSSPTPPRLRPHAAQARPRAAQAPPPHRPGPAPGHRFNNNNFIGT
ncbi:uncharacterized protein LOC131924344 [Peromyscus eremicus]|uniref:uncharacterized protein LOC131924344 n=1 Tax=Peromyscus eremicus TaxID=42410 RepID=UPI0027DB61BD|nr:uncharacterized protein LOC131924344 [Peromyscus eremicus]